MLPRMAPGTGAVDQVHPKHWWYPPADQTSYWEDVSSRYPDPQDLLSYGILERSCFQYTTSPHTTPHILPTRYIPLLHLYALEEDVGSVCIPVM